MKTLEEIKFEQNTRNQAGMTVPEGFFEQFQQRIESEVDRYESEKKKAVIPVIGRRQSFVRRWSVAAGIAALVGIGIAAYYVADNLLDINNSQIDLVAANSIDEEFTDAEEQDMAIGSISDFDLYDLYCDVY